MLKVMISLNGHSDRMEYKYIYIYVIYIYVRYIYVIYIYIIHIYIYIYIYLCILTLSAFCINVKYYSTRLFFKSVVFGFLRIFNELLQTKSVKKYILTAE